MQDPTPTTWVDGVTTLDDDNFNTEIRDAALLLLNPPTCILTRATDTTVANGISWHAITWDTTPLADTEAPDDPMFDSGSPTRITVQTPGYYECIINMSSLLGANIVMRWAVRINGGTVYELGSNFGQAVGTHKITSAAMLIPLNDGDYVEVCGLHNDATAKTVEATGNMPNFTVYRRRGL